MAPTYIQAIFRMVIRLMLCLLPLRAQPERAAHYSISRGSMLAIRTKSWSFCSKGTACSMAV